MELQVKRLTETAKLPTKAYDDPAGYDLYADEDAILDFGVPVKIKTGIATAFPAGFVGFIHDRGGMGSTGVHRFAGVVDSDYRGEWIVVLSNLNQLRPKHRITAGDKIAQVVFQRFENWPVVEVTHLDDTTRGEKGFGSSDNQ